MHLKSAEIDSSGTWMRKVVLDTDLFSECIKGKNLVVHQHFQSYLAFHERLTITSWTAFEVLTGIRHRLPHRLYVYEQAIASTDEIVPEAADYRLAAEIKGSLLIAGKPIGDIDPHIAACALNRSLPLATGNTKHYQAIADLGFLLELENWRVV